MSNVFEEKKDDGFASLIKVPMLKSRVNQLEKLYRDLELFTSSGSWELCIDEGWILFSEGGCRVLGLALDERELSLESLVAFCKEEFHAPLRGFFSNDISQQGAVRSLAVQMEDQDGCVISVCLCRCDDDPDADPRYISGLIKSLPPVADCC